MAEITPDSSLAEVINSLDLQSVPEKLHCSICHGFLLNAYKTSCCEQNVCEKCFVDITDHCLMCKHKPFSKDLCRPAKAMRNTVKAYLRSVEKSLVDERAKPQPDQGYTTGQETLENTEVADAQAEANREVENGTIEMPSAQAGEDQHISVTPATDIQPSIEAGPQPQLDDASATVPNDDESGQRQFSVETDANDDEVEIQVEPSAEDGILDMPQSYEMEEQDQQYDNSMPDQSKNGDANMHEMPNGMDSSGFNMQNANMMGFNNVGMDMNMMQQMMNMNQMMAMGMPMFGGFGGSNGNLNGMNMMGMNFNPGQMFNGWVGQNSNMWQNNNAMNAMGGDFGSQFGSNMSQQGSFYPQQFPNGDFNGYNGRPGRGRFRGGRGSYGRGRGSFNQYQQNTGYHSVHEQQQQEIQNMQAQMTPTTNGQDETVKAHANQKEEEPHDQDDFAPGGQDEVQEALGDEKQDAPSLEHESPVEVESKDHVVETNGSKDVSPEPVKDERATSNRERPGLEKIIPEAYHEDFESMAPPSAPTGPSGRYSDKEFAYRVRGHGKYSSRGRGSFSAPTGYPASPIRSASQNSIAAPSPPGKGAGVVGAPTGPRAMREPAAPKPAPRPAGNNGGFQIMGRASMQSQVNPTKDDDRSRSASPVNGHDDHEVDRSTSRRQSRYDRHDNSRDRSASGSNHGYDRNDRDRDRDRNRDRDRRNKWSKREEQQEDDYEMQDVDREYESPERRSSHKSSRHDRERNRREDRHSSNVKHRSSRRQREEDIDSEYDRDNHDDAVTDRHRSSRSGKSSSKHDSTRDSERDSYRERKRDRDRDRERDRDRDEDRTKDKDDRHRKRSRHDRDYEDQYDDPDDEESKHRSRRHKKEYNSSSSRRDREKDMDDADLGLRISGRSNSNRQSALPTPTSATSSVPPTSIADAEKDPHTLEREARNRERMLKEQQRREKAALDKRGGTTGAKTSSRATTSGGRRVSYKYEDEVERGLGAADEREKARWR